MTLKINSRRRQPVKPKNKFNVDLPEGELVDALYKVAREIAPRYRFGYHSKEDMIQEAIMEVLEKVLMAGKFKPRGNKDIARQLSAFLRVHMRNRCSNMVRNKSCRYTNPDSFLNKAKYNIMHPLYIYNQELKEDFFVQEENDRNELHDCLEYIRVNLEDDQLADLDLMRDGKKLSITKQRKLIAAIEKLFEEIDCDDSEKEE